MRHISGALDGVLDRLGLSRVVEQHDVFRTWAERVGPEIARAAHPYRIDGETLILRVANSAWMNELSLRQGELLKRLNAGRTHSAVKRLIFRLDPESKG
jgi:predicted nucleic acid-binding Zn ribbon protein